MDALNLVIKSLLLTALVVFCMQIKYDGQTIEEKTLGTLEDAGISHFIHDTALGGIEAMKDLYKAITAKAKAMTNEERASR